MNKSRGFNIDLRNGKKKYTHISEPTGNILWLRNIEMVGNVPWEN